MRTASLLIAIAIGAVAAPIQARQTVAELIQSADSNRDGQLSRNELIAATSTQAKNDRMDANGDGLISAAELNAHFARSFSQIGHPADPKIILPMVTHSMQAWDLNGNGKLTVDEYAQAIVNETFGSADANGDQRLSSHELRAFRGGSQ